MVLVVVGFGLLFYTLFQADRRFQASDMELIKAEQETVKANAGAAAALSKLAEVQAELQFMSGDWQ